MLEYHAIGCDCVVSPSKQHADKLAGSPYRANGQPSTLFVYEHRWGISRLQAAISSFIIDWLHAATAALTHSAICPIPAKNSSIFDVL